MKIIEKNRNKISLLTLGTVQLGMPYGINNSQGMPSEEVAFEILDTAINNGILSFDTAKGYGVSESVLGNYFKKSKAENTVITKIRFSDEPRSFVKDKVRRDVLDSLDKLGLARIPTLLLHNNTYIETYGDTLRRALADIKEEGLVDEVGISFSDKTHLLDYTADPLYTAVQLPLNMLDSEEIRNGSLEKLEERGVTVYARSLYLQGLFFKDPSSLQGRLVSAAPILSELRSLCEREGMSMAELALSYVRDVKGVTSLVVGAETPEQVCDTLAALSAPALSASTVARINELASSVERVVIRPWEWTL